jgi:hypothetical protein
VVPHALPLRCAFVATLILPAVGRAQEPQSSTRDRLFVSAGLGWSVCHCQFHGAQLRAEYSLTPAERVVGLRMDLGAFWTPAQRYSFPSALYDQGATTEGVGQSTVLNLGVTSVITPWPRGRVSPYVVAGVAALQTWSSGSGYYRRANGTVGSIMPPNFGTHGDIRAIVGAGLRVRVGGRLVQLEARELRGSLSAITLGTTLHF